jgi:hypothetical protein
VEEVEPNPLRETEELLELPFAIGVLPMALLPWRGGLVVPGVSCPDLALR